MRKTKCIAIAAAVAIGVSACGASKGASSEADVKKQGRLIVGVRYDSPPFGSLNPGTNKPEGFDIDIAKELAKRIVGSKDDANLKKVDSATRIPQLQQGDIDVSVATITITDERKKQVDFSLPYFPSGMAILVPAGSPITSAEDIENKTNCVTTGAVAGKLVAEAAKKSAGVENIKELSLGSYPECILALKQGRADFIGTDQGTLLGLAQQNKNVRVLPTQLSDEPWGIAVAKGNTSLRNAVNSALKQMFADGTWTKLYRKWISEKIPAGWPPAA